MRILCAYCLNMSNNAQFPVLITWQKPDGETDSARPLGSDQMATAIAEHVAEPGFRINVNTYVITDPWAVTFIGGTACCPFHAGSYVRWPLEDERSYRTAPPARYTPTGGPYRG